MVRGATSILWPDSVSVDSPAVPKATKRERQHQNRDARRAAMEEEAKRHRRNRTIRNFALLLVPLVVLFVILQLTNSNDSKNTSSTNDIKRSYAKAPEQTIDPTAAYTATIDTSEGTIVVGLDAAQYPTSVNNFVFLAKNKFYDGLRFNRAAKDFVIQTGSPDNTTAGGPGYSVVGEVPTTTPAYPVGAVAFAKAGNEPTGTAGSQFFIVTGSSNLDLPADYAGIGTVTQGLDVAQKIDALAPASGDGTPTKKVTIKKITISETPATTTTAAPTTLAP
jgi:cyclophilin family peptidyl-prolyl cis-trans isomerase